MKRGGWEGGLCASPGGQARGLRSVGLLAALGGLRRGEPMGFGAGLDKREKTGISRRAPGFFDLSNWKELPFIERTWEDCGKSRVFELKEKLVDLT